MSISTQAIYIESTAAGRLPTLIKNMARRSMPTEPARIPDHRLRHAGHDALEVRMQRFQQHIAFPACDHRRNDEDCAATRAEPLVTEGAGLVQVAMIPASRHAAFIVMLNRHVARYADLNRDKGLRNPPRL